MFVELRHRKGYGLSEMCATLKQKLAIEKVMEKHGNISSAMREVGYKLATAKNPKNLTESKGWGELMDKYLPDTELLEVHKKALHATKIHGSLTEPDREVDDIPTSLKAVELGYKVKGKLQETQVLQQFNVGGEMTIEFISDDGAKNEVSSQTNPVATDSSKRSP